MMNKVEITKILVAIEVVIALVIIGLIIYLRDPLSVSANDVDNTQAYTCQLEG